MYGFIFLLISIYSGILISNLLKELKLLERILTGIIIGFLLAIWSTFLFYLLTKNLSHAFWSSSALITCIAIYLSIKSKINKKKTSQTLKTIRHSLKPGIVIFFTIFGILFFIYFEYFMLNPKTDGLYTSAYATWGDLPYHLSLINHFRYGTGTLEYPIFIGERLTYPFLFDFYTAALSGPGNINLRAVLIILGVLLSLVTILLMYALSLRLDKRKSIALLSVLLLTLGSGMGFAYYIKNVFTTGSLAVTENYSHLPKAGIDWSNFITSHLLPQRTFLIGFPTGLIIILLFFIFINTDNEKTKLRTIIFAGLLAGTLPMIHTHTFLGISLLGLVLAFSFLSWTWLYFFAIAEVLALPQIIWILSRITSTGFIKLDPGWLSNATNLLQFSQYWLRNTGFVLILGIAGIFLVKGKQKKFLLSFWILFIAGNLLRFTPNNYDNIKIMFIWWTGMAILASTFLAWAYDRGILGKISFTLLLLLSTSSGALGIYDTYNNHRLFSTEEIELAEWIREHTSPEDIFLTSDRYNHPVPTLAGRRILLGYKGWLWTHGVNYSERDKDVHLMFTSNESKKLFAEYKVNYIIIGPSERDELKANETYIMENFNTIHKTKNYEIFEVA